MVSSQDSSKVVGFIAFAKAKPLVFCEGAACIVSGSEKTYKNTLLHQAKNPENSALEKLNLSMLSTL